MPGLVPGIPIIVALRHWNRDGRDKPGYDASGFAARQSALRHWIALPSLSSGPSKDESAEALRPSPFEARFARTSG
jgi:hypothetical protein